MRGYWFNKLPQSSGAAPVMLAARANKTYSVVVNSRGITWNKHSPGNWVSTGISCTGTQIVNWDGLPNIVELPDYEDFKGTLGFWISKWTVYPDYEVYWFIPGFSSRRYWITRYALDNEENAKKLYAWLNNRINQIYTYGTIPDESTSDDATEGGSETPGEKGIITCKFQNKYVGIPGTGTGETVVPNPPGTDIFPENHLTPTWLNQYWWLTWAADSYVCPVTFDYDNRAVVSREGIQRPVQGNMTGITMYPRAYSQIVDGKRTFEAPSPLVFPISLQQELSDPKYYRMIPFCMVDTSGMGNYRFSDVWCYAFPIIKLKEVS